MVPGAQSQAPKPLFPPNEGLRFCVRSATMRVRLHDWCFRVVSSESFTELPFSREHSPIDPPSDHQRQR